MRRVDAEAVLQRVPRDAQVLTRIRGGPHLVPHDYVRSVDGYCLRGQHCRHKPGQHASAGAAPHLGEESHARRPILRLGRERRQVFVTEVLEERRRVRAASPRTLLRSVGGVGGDGADGEERGDVGGGTGEMSASIGCASSSLYVAAA